MGNNSVKVPPGTIDWLSISMKEANPFREDEWIICKRCGVDWRWGSRWKKYNICRDCRDALDDLEGKHEWHSESQQAGRIRTYNNRVNRVEAVDPKDFCCKDVVNVEHSECKGSW